MNWEVGLRHVRAELTASGFLVQQETSSAVNPSDLLIELRNPDKNDDLIASVTVLRIGRSGLAYVWLHDEGRMYRAEGSHTDPSEAATILSLKIVELIRLRGDGFTSESKSTAASEQQPPSSPSNRRTRSAEAPSKANVKNETAPRQTSSKSLDSSSPTDPRPFGFRASALGGIAFGSGLDQPLPELGLDLSHQFLPWFSWGVSGVSSLGSSLHHYEKGAIRLRSHRLLLRLALSHGQRLWWQVGPKGGLHCLQTRTISSSVTQSSTRTTCAFALGGFARTGLQLGGLSLFLEGELGATTRALRLLEDKEVVATLGRPWTALHGGLGWQF